MDLMTAHALVRRAAQRCGAVAARHTGGARHILFDSRICLTARPLARGTEIRSLSVRVDYENSRRLDPHDDGEYVHDLQQDDAEDRLTAALAKVHEAALNYRRYADPEPRPDVLSALLAVQRRHPDRLSVTAAGDGSITVQAGPVVRVTIMADGITFPVTLTCGHEGRRLFHLIRRVLSGPA